LQLIYNIKEATKVANDSVLNKKTVLVADDESSVLYSVRRILGDKYSIIEASNGKEAVRLAQSQKPDIIFMDTMMPEKDGLIALSEIRANDDTKTVPVIMLTGLDYELNKKLAQTLGASGYITKPFKAQDILDAVSNLGIV
jgi:two-component system alkaline phosphatase synthesis response regulator PhoP